MHDDQREQQPRRRITTPTRASEADEHHGESHDERRADRPPVLDEQLEVEVVWPPCEESAAALEDVDPGFLRVVAQPDAARMVTDGSQRLAPQSPPIREGCVRGWGCEQPTDPRLLQRRGERERQGGTERAEAEHVEAPHRPTLDDGQHEDAHEGGDQGAA